MRHLILALMIVLLPLRGWMGDVMAMEAVSSAQISIISVAENDRFTLGKSGFYANSGESGLPVSPLHCPDHASALDGGSTDTDGDHAAHGGCTACQVCHTVAMSADAAPLPTLPLPALTPATSFPGFTSAQPAPGLKPPIA